MTGFEHDLEHKHSPAASTWYAKVLLRESWINLKNTQMLPSNWPEWEESSLPLPMLNKIIQKTATLTQLPFCWPREAPSQLETSSALDSAVEVALFLLSDKGTHGIKKRLVGGPNMEKQRETPFLFLPYFYCYPPPNTDILTPPIPGENNLPQAFGFKKQTPTSLQLYFLPGNKIKRKKERISRREVWHHRH